MRRRSDAAGSATRSLAYCSAYCAAFHAPSHRRSHGLRGVDLPAGVGEAGWEAETHYAPLGNKIEFKELFKTLTTRPTQVHQPFTIQLYAYDTSVGAQQDPAVVAQYGLNYPGTSWVAAQQGHLRAVSEMVSGALTTDKFMTLTFEYDEYDTAPRTH